jgi:hypothetical protein
LAPARAPAGPVAGGSSERSDLTVLGAGIADSPAGLGAAATCSCSKGATASAGGAAMQPQARSGAGGCFRWLIGELVALRDDDRCGSGMSAALGCYLPTTDAPIGPCVGSREPSVRRRPPLAGTGSPASPRRILMPGKADIGRFDDSILGT